MKTEPAHLAHPIASGIQRYTFSAAYDGSPSTFLLKDFRAETAGDCPLLVIYLHGALSHEDQGMTAGIYGNAFGRWAEQFSARGAVYLCPEYRGNSWMGPAAESDLLEVIHWARAAFRPQRVVLMGGSMGGTSSLIFAARHGDQLDGVIALCPASDPSEMYATFPDHFLGSYGGSPDEKRDEFAARTIRQRPGKLIELPLAIVHGSADTVIPVHHSRCLLETLSGHPALHYIEMEGGNHDAPLALEIAPLLDFVLQPKNGEDAA